MLDWIHSCWDGVLAIWHALPDWRSIPTILIVLLLLYWQEERMPGRRTRDTSHESGSDY